jgi:hypothetical protein
MEAAGALIAAIGTVAAFTATFRSARAQERTLAVQADQLALQQKELADERLARREAEDRERRDAMVNAMHEIDRNLKALDEDLPTPLSDEYLNQACRLMLRHAPEEATDVLRQAVFAVGSYGTWARSNPRAVGAQATKRVEDVKGPLREARSVLKNMEMAVGRPEASGFFWT